MVILENEIYIYIYIYIFGWFSSSWNEKKKKKKKLQAAGIGYYPFFSKCESQYIKLYCDIGLDRQGLGAQQARMVGHDTAGWATIQPTTRPSARASGLAGGECVTIQSLYRDRSEGLPGWGWVMIQSIVS